MTLYTGPREDDEAPAHGGKFIERGCLGHEAFNFLTFNGRLYGTFGIIAENINLRNIDRKLPRDAGAVEGVLVIFFARAKDGQQIVGWYNDAKVLKRATKYPSEVSRSIQKRLDEEVKRRRNLGTDATAISEAHFKNYRLEAESSKAVLLPISVRAEAPRIPRGHDATGQFNVCYLNKNGSPKSASWIGSVLQFVRNYKRHNLLLAESEEEAEAFDSQERDAGFEPNAKVRKAVEEYAMDRAEKELYAVGFRNFIRTHKTECYDHTCRKGGRLYYIETKGTRGDGKSVILTKNEVDHWEQHKRNSIAVIVHHIKVDSKYRADGGTAKVCLPWSIRKETLETTQYRWITTDTK
jgi:hypothetical protein